MAFFFIGGIQSRTVVGDKLPRICPACGYQTLFLKRTDHYLSLFFIPIFPVKKGTPFLACNHCQALLDEKGRERERRQAWIVDNCPSCSRGISHDFSFCPYCGRRL